ncbi:hypothetical protein O181_005434 [Austropuccinia psidii MF-1]|uniref:Uncharacterized protein n=1 Tax=Austropuccinia psidii MF-1 TaxID=1389203 RepID=A0A9Q3BHF4_9BASI|nr:hypothetical protein [Austropuccinia psidii MF-1]
MESPFLRYLGYPRGQKEIWQGRLRRGRRQPPSGSNEKQGTYNQENPSQSTIKNQIQPSPSNKLSRCIKGPSDASTHEKPVHMEYGKYNFYHETSL